MKLWVQKNVQSLTR